MSSNVGITCSSAGLFRNKGPPKASSINRWRLKWVVVALLVIASAAVSSTFFGIRIFAASKAENEPRSRKVKAN